jgi:catechol 2,3-dioxygenase-like lactoylglutathione lyase family enzyme
MNHSIKSIRPFIGAKNFDLSRSFYSDLGFKETALGGNFSVFEMGNFAFYLQDAYVKDWVDNTMIFLEVEDLDAFWAKLEALNLTTKYNEVKLIPIRDLHWGRVFFLHDPSGILWQIGAFLH